MRRNNRVVARKNLPNTLPVTHTIALITAMHYFEWGDLGRGMVIAWLILIWAASIHSLCNEEPHELEELRERRKFGER